MLTKEEREQFISRLRDEGIGILEEIDERYKDDETLMKALVKLNGALIYFASDRLKKNEELSKFALSSKNDYLGRFNGKKHDFAIQFVDKDFLRRNPEYIVRFLEKNMEYASVLDKDLLSIKEVEKYVLSNLSKNSMLWFDLPDEVKFRKDVVMQVIHDMPNMIAKLPLEIQSDPEVLKKASFNHDPEFNAVTAMYGYLHPDVARDPEVCRILVEADPRVFPYLQCYNEEIIQIGLSYNGEFLSRLDEKDRDNEQYVLLAVRNNGMALDYASERLKDNKTIVKEAVKQVGWSINCASDKLKNDPEIINLALNSSPELDSYGWKRPTSGRK